MSERAFNTESKRYKHADRVYMNECMNDFPI